MSPTVSGRAFLFALFAFGCVLEAIPATAATRVVLISIDGLRPDAITPDGSPNLTALLARGTHAARAINDLPSATLPNHATMLTGVTSARHGVLVDFAIPGAIQTPTIFDFAHDAGLRAAFFASKTKLEFLASPGAIESTIINGDLPALVAEVLEQIAADGPDLIFVHLRDPDSTGHRAGWMSVPYLDAVRQVDELVGEIVAAIDAEKSRDTYLIVTADHGGEGLNHFLNTAVDRTIPWIAVGPGIASGVEIDDVISIADTAPTVLNLLGVDLHYFTSDANSDVGRPINLVAQGVTDSARSAPIETIGPPCVILVIPVLLIPVLAWMPRARRGR